jgi:hypothetical protein
VAAGCRVWSLFCPLWQPELRWPAEEMVLGARSAATAAISTLLGDNLGAGLRGRLPAERFEKM